MTFLTIDGNSNLKVPATLQVDLQDLQSSETGRTQNGNMYIDRVVGGAKAKRKVSCTWKGLSQNEISALLQAMSKASFPIKYPDPYTGSFRTATVYVGDRSAPMFKTGATKPDKIIWESLSANFIEL